MVSELRHSFSPWNIKTKTHTFERQFSFACPVILFFYTYLFIHLFIWATSRQIHCFISSFKQLVFQHTLYRFCEMKQKRVFRAQDWVEMGWTDSSSLSHLYIFNLGLGQQQLLVIVSLSLLSLCLQLQHGFLGLSQSLSEICNLTDNVSLTCFAGKKSSQSQTTKILTAQSSDKSSLSKMM